MDFTQSGNRPNASQSGAGNGAASSSGHGKRKKAGFEWLRLSFVTLLFSGTILVAAVLIFISVGSPKSESKLVNTGGHQAVFLSNGQVYFGKITDLNDKYVRINDLYYLRQSESPQPDKNTSAGSSNFSLVKLGCEIHGPSDEMVINHDQLSFWENLKKDGQVVKAIDEFKKNNPNGQQCSQTSTDKP